MRFDGRFCAKASHETERVRVTRRSKRRDLRDRSGNTHGKACIGVGRWALDPRGRPTLVVTWPDRASMGHAEQGLRTRQSGAIPAPPMDGGTNGGEVEGPLCRDSQDNTPAHSPRLLTGLRLRRSEPGKPGGLQMRCQKQKSQKKQPRGWPDGKPIVGPAIGKHARCVSAPCFNAAKARLPLPSSSLANLLDQL